MHPTLLLAKSQPLALNYWKAQLEEAGYTVLPFCKKASDWLSVIRQTKPYLLFIEATFANNTGLELVRQTRLLHPATRCVVCVPALPAYYLKAIEVDASGYLPDNIGDPAEVLHCFEQVGQGYRYISPIFSAVLPLPTQQKQEAVNALSDRHRQILRLVAKGYTSRQIGVELNLSVSTVDNHKYQMSQKLGLPGVHALKVFAGSVAFWLAE